MLLIRYPKWNTQIEDWQHLLQRLALAHKLEEDKELKSPVLEEGKTRHEGGSAISDYLLQLDQESGSWWYCSC
ncbi:MAG: hypothetical protein DHS20C18_11380 [Saprospiraceae bacterium]|nr:MAG: hypothetical protein DHS20C18_11380 [Saprospiraceae bacterium]